MIEVGPFHLVRARLIRESVARIEPLIGSILADTWRHKKINQPRWSGPLTTHLAEVGNLTVEQIGALVVAGLGGNQTLASGESAWSPAGARNYILKVAGSQAENRLAWGSRLLRGAPDDLDLDLALQRIAQILQDSPAQMVTTAANFTAVDAGERLGATRKRWVVTSSNPRDTHAAQNGSEVGIRDAFWNGLRFPGSGGPPEETVNCLCEVVIVKPDRGVG